jgi:hypothetical protein
MWHHGKTESMAKLFYIGGDFGGIFVWMGHIASQFMKVLGMNT